MYYDTVQFVMDLEERFHITLPDVDAERITTMGNLCDYLANRARLFVMSPCATASAFYKLRRSLSDYGVPASTIRPKTCVSPLLAKQQMRDVWRETGDRFGTVLPSLRWRWRLRVTFCMYAVASLSLLPFSVTVAPDSLILLIGMAAIASLLLIVGYAYADRFASVIPQRRVATVGALSRWLVDRCYLPTDRPDDEIEPWIWAEISDILCSKMDVDRASLNRDTSFVDDLFVDDL
jgi:acyl carrier protein